MTLTETREARALAKAAKPDAQEIERLLITGDLAKLSPDQRSAYYLSLCQLAGLNPLTQPFEYLTLNNKLVLYAKKACTDQLRAIHKVSVVDMDQVECDGVYSVTVKVQNGDGRTDMDVGVVKIASLTGDNRANAMMKAATKAKRRATLSICGLGMLDEAEIETIPAAALQKPESSAQLKKNGAWESFRDRVQGFVEAGDAAGLEAWWASPAVCEKIAAWPQQWRDSAEEEYERATETVAHALADAESKR
jgi:hypothetical protein